MSAVIALGPGNDRARVGDLRLLGPAEARELEVCWGWYFLSPDGWQGAYATPDDAGEAFLATPAAAAPRRPAAQHCAASFGCVREDGCAPGDCVARDRTPAPPAYAYIRQQYGVDPKVGQRIAMAGKPGTILRPVGDPQYLRVLFDDAGHPVNVHPTWKVEYGEAPS